MSDGSDPKGTSKIAIVGMACLFPRAPDLETYWDNVKNGVDAISEVPPSRIDPIFFDKNVHAMDRFYCKRGGFVDDLASFDALSYGVMPVAARGAEPDQLLALDVAARALADAGYEDRAFPRDRAAVILGRGGYAGPGRTRLDQHVRVAEQLVSALRSILPDIGEDVLARAKAELQARVNAAGADAAIGLVPNLAASRIAQRLDLRGPAYTVDAACASALLAVDHGVRELAAGRCDFVLAGGVHFCHDETFWSVFCQLGALSHREKIRPFDRNADGLLIGEGAGIVALKRLDDAERAGDRIYAVISGVGTSSDGRGATLMSPSVGGQVLALSRAWEASGLAPSQVGLVEAHGTGTPAGDEAELNTLAQVFGAHQGDAPRAVLGSVKSMIGHTMPAAGAAGLIKAALSIFHGVLPPTLHCDDPHEKMAQTRFRTIAKSEPWDARGGSRVAGVNAFGFGGINAHVVVEEHRAKTKSSVARATSSSARVAVFSAPTHADLAVAVSEGREARDGGSARVVVFDPTPARLLRAKEIVTRGKDWRGRDGVFFSSEPLLASLAGSNAGTIAFIFPGVDASFEPRVDDVAKHFSLPTVKAATPGNLEEIGIGIVAVNRMLNDVLRRLKVTPKVIAGHSIGEWSGMIASGVLAESDVDDFIASTPPGSLEVPGVVFAAAGCGVEQANEAMAGLDPNRIALSHDNCPHQILLCGHEQEVETALERLRARSVLCQKLPFKSGFHSPLFSAFLGPHRAHFAKLPINAAKVPLLSATTCEPYPSDPNEVRALAIEHLVRPVRFRELIEKMYKGGVRAFIQVGTGSLANFVEDTLRGRRHLAISANVKDRSGMDQLRRLLAAIYVEGGDVDMSLFASRAPMKLSLGVPIVRDFSAISLPRAQTSAITTTQTLSAELSPNAAAHPLAPDFHAALSEIAQAERDVLELLASPDRVRVRASVTSAPREAVSQRRFSLDTMPELIDHTFFRQPIGWRVLSDLHPVVPMTASIELMIEHAIAMVPGRVAIALEDVRAYRWLVTATPLDLEIKCRYDGASRVHVRIADYSEGTVILGDSYADAPPDDVAPLDNEVSSDVDAKVMYDERYMFHGPAYRGIVKVAAMGDDGVRGQLEAPPARGALLDNAGQLFGFWVMVSQTQNRMAMPVRIARLDLYGALPKNHERLTCTVRIRSISDTAVVSDLALGMNGKMVVQIQGWEDRRFETDERLWPLMRFPENNLLATPHEGGFVVFDDKYRAAPTRDQLTRRFLGEKERAALALEGPRVARQALASRIAVKDAVRDLLFRLGHGPMFPVEIELTNASSDCPEVRTATARHIRVCVARKDDVAVAIASEDRLLGIAIEKVGTEPEGALTDDERKLAGEARSAEDTTRIYASKRAVSRARNTDAAEWVARDRAGDRFLIDNTWVSTTKIGDLVIAWMNHE